MWLCGLAAMTSASRMVYAFARDGGLPFSKTWARVSPRHFTPSNAIWGLSALAMILALSVKIYSAVISIATISLYISYGIPIAARLYARMKSRDAVKGPWSLGKFSSLNAVVAVLWISFITIVFVLPPNDQAMTVVGVCVLALVLLWFSFVRHRFKGPKFQFKG
jgi:amino acid transporter